jgi:hypothetical protein
LSERQIWRAHNSAFAQEDREANVQAAKVKLILYLASMEAYSHSLNIVSRTVLVA